MTWTKKPPSEPGWYFHKDIWNDVSVERVFWFEGNLITCRVKPMQVDLMTGKWWPERIPEPPESNWDNFEKVREVLDE